MMIESGLPFKSTQKFIVSVARSSLRCSRRAAVDPQCSPGERLRRSMVLNVRMRKASICTISLSSTTHYTACNFIGPVRHHRNCQSKTWQNG